MPFPPHKATIVLPDFGRSCSADGETKKERWSDRKAGRAYGGNDGLAFAMCGALQKRKEPAGRAEAFFCLDLLVTFGSSQK